MYRINPVFVWKLETSAFAYCHPKNALRSPLCVVVLAVLAALVALVALVVFVILVVFVAFLGDFSVNCGLRANNVLLFARVPWTSPKRVSRKNTLPSTFLCLHLLFFPWWSTAVLSLRLDTRMCVLWMYVKYYVCTGSGTRKFHVQLYGEPYTYMYG